MNPINPQNKILGVALGVIVIGSVSYITLFGENKTSLTQAEVQAPTTIPAPMYGDAVPVTNQVTDNTPKPKSLVQRFFGDDEGEGEGEEGGGNLPNQPLPTPPPAVTTKPTTKTTASIYKNGTYSATGNYMSPGGPDQIAITVTISKDVITSVSGVNMAGDNTSSRYQDRFLSGFKPYVVGQKISSVYLTKVSGASLTPIGFNDALNQIKAQAKA